MTKKSNNSQSFLPYLTQLSDQFFQVQQNKDTGGAAKINRLVNPKEIHLGATIFRIE